MLARLWRVGRSMSDVHSFLFRSDWPFFRPVARCKRVSPSVRYITLPQHPDDMVYNILHFFLWQSAGFFAEPTFINRNYMGASGKTRSRQVRITLLEQNVTGYTRMFGLLSEWNDRNRLKFAAVDRISKHEYDRSFIIWHSYSRGF